MDSMPDQRKRKGIGAWEKILGEGQNPRGFTAQVPAGTSKAGPNVGWNKDYRYENPQIIQPEGAWKNSNRTGE